MRRPIDSRRSSTASGRCARPSFGIPRAAAEGLARQRRELQHLVRRAGELLTQHGDSRNAGRRCAGFRTRCLAPLSTASIPTSSRHGRLMQELAAPGFEVLAGVGRADHLKLLKGGKAGSADTGRPRRLAASHQQSPADLKEEAARQRRDAARQREETATREREEAAARQREEIAARKRQEAEAQQRDMAERRAAVEQADQEAKELKRASPRPASDWPRPAARRNQRRAATNLRRSAPSRAPARFSERRSLRPASPPAPSAS